MTQLPAIDLFELDTVLDQYAELEIRVREAIASLCHPCCAACVSVCCKPEFCQESVESAFLSLLCEKYSPPVSFCAEKGFLGESGCTLSVGRPPVCYEFFCTGLLLSPPFREYPLLMKRLSRLMTHAGRNLLGNRHLVELLDKSDLLRINRPRFEKQMAEVTIGFQEVMRMLNRAAP